MMESGKESISDQDSSCAASSACTSFYGTQYLDYNHFLRVLLTAQEASAVEANMETEAPLHLETYLSDLLMQIGIPPHVHGYRYLQKAILMTIQDPSLIDHMTSRLYPALAQTEGKAVQCVERSIRHAIAMTWERGGFQVLNQQIGRCCFLPDERTTNREFIAILAELVRNKCQIRR